MAGARLALDVDVGPAGAVLLAMIDKLEGDGRRILLSDIGEYLLRSTRDRAGRQVGPDGTPWQALSPRYKKFKDGKRPGVPMLKFDYHMLGDQMSWQVNGDELLVGTNAKYGAIHQFGGTIKMPARSSKSYFKHDKRTGEVGNRFVSKKKANFEQWHTRPAHDVTIPARPWLGLSAEDEVEVLAITADHLELVRFRGKGPAA